eukprot:jgi/Galph1/3399/GphlegSOOS_G2033.1
MNLLPHKSWNIWSTKNIAKIERDEAVFERQQLQNKQKEEQRWREYRLEKLRKKAKGGQVVEEQHVNLFEREEQNDLQPKEEKPAVTTIKQTLNNSLSTPWYIQESNQRKERKKRKFAERDGSENSRQKRQEEEKQKEDPLSVINQWNQQRKVESVSHQKRFDKKRKKEKDASGGNDCVLETGQVLSKDVLNELREARKRREARERGQYKERFMNN